MFRQLENVFYKIGDVVISMGKQVGNVEIQDENITNELVIRSAVKADVCEIETVISLASKTKYEICLLAEEKYGLVLNMRDTKNILITNYLAEQEVQLAA